MLSSAAAETSSIQVSPQSSCLSGTPQCALGAPQFTLQLPALPVHSAASLCMCLHAQPSSPRHSQASSVPSAAPVLPLRGFQTQGTSQLSSTLLQVSPLGGGSGQRNELRGVFHSPTLSCWGLRLGRTGSPLEHHSGTDRPRGRLRSPALPVETGPPHPWDLLLNTFPLLLDLNPAGLYLEGCAPALAVMPVLSSSPDLGRFCFPGLKKMQSSLKLVDCILEVHDARISFGTCDARVFGIPIFSPGPFLHSV